MGGGRDNDEEAVVFRRGGKYRSSAKTLLPYRRKKTTGHPADNAGLFSTVLFSWLTGLVWKLYRKPVPVESLWQAPESDRGQINSDRFIRLWNEEVKTKGKKASMKWVFYRFIKTRFVISIISVFAFVAFQFASNGVIIRALLMYVEEEDPNIQTGLYIVGAMFLAEVFRMLFFALNFAVGIRTGVRLRSGVTMAVFKKVLNIPPTESSNIGEIVNLSSNDGDRLFEAVYVGSLLFTSPIMFISVTAYLCVLVGPISLVGTGLFVVILVLQVALMKALNVLRQRAMVYTDKRVKAINEVVSAIKLIKMYAWEESFSKVIRGIRTKERNVLFQASFVQSINMAIASLSPYLATIVTILFSLMLGRNITVSEGFTCFSMYNVMSFSLKVIPFALKNVAEAAVAADRVQKIMERKEFTKYLKSETSAPNIAIEMRKASLSWPTDDDNDSSKRRKNSDSNEEKHALAGNGDSSHPPQCLQQIDFEVTKGDLVGVCGRVGCGKSSLIAGILGHLQPLDGSVAVDGSTAYCAQQAWIMNATIRDNITFGLPYDKVKYNKIVEACCLLPDFEILQSGDMTEVGERGVNLSGGQKQRINIARALYMDKEIYLLDDPLSAVDAHVGKALFEKAILAMLKKAGKTIVLVTHRIEYLPHCDRVILMKSGRIWETGTHDDLMDNGEDYYQLYKMWCKEEEDEVDEEEEVVAPKSPGVQSEHEFEEEIQVKIEQGRLMTLEDSGQGSIRSETYSMYFQAAGGWLVTIMCVFLFMVFVCCLQFNSFWLSYWLKQGSGRSVITNTTNEEVINATNAYNSSSIMNTTSVTGVLATTIENQAGANMSFSDEEDRVLDNPDLYFYMYVFGYALAATVITMTLKAYVFMKLSLRASHRLHNTLFDKVLHATMEFFDTTPTGRILNRFQKDQDMLDNLIPLLLDLVMTFSMFLISCVVFVAFVFPYFLIVLVVMVPIFLAAYFMFKGAIREMRRQDNVTRSPWLSHITTTITGIHTIRAYKRIEDFIERFSELLNINTIPFFLFASVNRWLVTRLDFMTIILIAICSLLVVFTAGIIPAAYAGLAVTSALMMSTLFQFTVRTTVETEANFVCAERIIQYIKVVPQEPGREKKIELDPKWPKFGSLRFVNVDMRYREGLPLVLKNISFNIDTCEKIGVVGRTGSGKSSLGVALFRLVELSGGSIEIDGVDISQLSLSQLRSKIAIIPQEPVLFTGTVKYNVDPFDQYTDEDIWQALERTHLKEAISSLPLKLQAPVSENGGNFSVGERQLMCLARALLRHNKILVLDEATASIDATTDELVQETIKEHFADCTLITIAHRLNTVLTCDRIMVLERGCVEEFDTPDNLSKDPHSLFSKLLTSTKV